MHVFSLCKTRSNAAMRFCTCHGAGNIIETLHNLVRNNMSGLIFICLFNYLFKQVVVKFLLILPSPYCFAASLRNITPI